MVLQVRVNLEDYLAERTTGRIVEGDKKNKELQNIWILKMEAGQWKLNIIMDSSYKYSYARTKNDFAAAQDHLASGLRFNPTVNN